MLREVARVRGNLVRNQARLDVVAVWQSEVLLGRHVAQQSRARRADRRRANRARDVVVRRRDVRGKRAERVERRLAAPLELVLHVDRNLVQRHVSRSFIHHLHVLLPRAARKVALHLELGELRLVVRVLDASRTQAVANGQRDVVLRADVEDVVPVLVRKVLRIVVDQHVLCVDRPAARHDAGDALRGERHKIEQHARVNRPVVHALFRLLDKRLAEELPRDVGYVTFRFL
mmetsp:Transcript_5622/g.12903  ORF Transcript_5622/g.12903 Transcript_5622/m.12903 type:complete len:231 (-) Transcript_5622:1056-1748(-)